MRMLFGFEPNQDPDGIGFLIGHPLSIVPLSLFSVFSYHGFDPLT